MHYIIVLPGAHLVGSRFNILNIVFKSLGQIYVIRFHTHYPSCLLSEVNMSLAKDLILCDICLSDILALGFAYAGEWVKDMIRSGTSDFCTAASFHSIKHI